MIKRLKNIAEINSNLPIDYSLPGLTKKEARARIKIFGYNQLVKSQPLSAWRQLTRHFKDPLVIILILAAIISGFVGEIKNTLIIIALVFLSAAMKFYQEFKSNKAALRLAKKLATKATVIRNGIKKDTLIEFLVPGDVVLLAAGDIIPADGKIIKADDFFVNESAFTGESFPVEKTATGEKDHHHKLVYNGTNVISGSSLFAVTTTGANTEFGKISAKLNETAVTNAFEIGVKRFGYLIVRLTIFLVLAIFFI